MSTASNNAPPGTGWRAEAGTQLSNGRASEASTVQTYTNVVVSFDFSKFLLLFGSFRLLLLFFKSPYKSVETV